MLKDLFSNRLFIGALVFFIFCVVGSLLYQQHVERQAAEALAEAQARVKAFNERQKAARTETSESGALRGEGVLSQSELDASETETPSLSVEALKKIASEVEISEAEREAFYRSHGLEPPPAGHTYMINRDGSIELIKDGVPIVELHSRQGFDAVYLSEEDWELYQALKGMTNDYIIGTENIPPEVVEMARERLEALKANGQGPIFTGTVSTVWEDLTPPSPEVESGAYYAKVAAAYLELGITPELRKRRNTYHYDYDLIGQLIAEFKEALR
ncbi:hypothetical protein F4009_11605 [Candidatus Poribacteria bacterium]|nr:hypothetical protein [Candidatus Poribacteria bacterium]MYK94618.1 hypothetical protein [Candidatus Poribacteria bacterium]